MADPGIKISSTFNPQTGIPLDQRTVRSTIVDRDAISLFVRYEGMACYVTSNQTLYRLKGGIQNVNWTVDTVIKYNLSATTPPSTNDNASQGYSEGSIWYDNAGGITYLLTNFVGNDATWVTLSGQFWTLVNW